MFKTLKFSSSPARMPVTSRQSLANTRIFANSWNSASSRAFAPLLALAFLATGVPVAEAQAPVRPPVAAAPSASPPKAPDPAYLAAEKVFLALDIEARRAIQRDLIWVANFSATTSGDFGPLTFAALKRFETGAKSGVDGILVPAERERLGKEAEQARRAARFAVETDKVSGMKIGVPAAIFVKSSPNASGGTRWQDKDEKITLDLAVYKKEDSLATLFEKGTDAKVQGRKITYKLLRSDFFVITGETASGKFYRRVQADPGGAIRGFSIGYDKAIAASLDKMVIAISASFDPFGKAAPGNTTPAKPDDKPALVAEAPKQRRATGLVLAPETILTAEAALKSCTEIVVAGENKDPENKDPKIPARLARRVEGTGLLVLTAKAGRALPVRVAMPVNGAAILIQRDLDGELLASSASLNAAKAATSLQEGGAGAALFDRTGALVGVINGAPISKFRVAGIVPSLSYGFLPAADALKSAGLPAGASGGESAPKSSAEIAELARASIVSLVCASDR